jgi:hypothetical protein
MTLLDDGLRKGAAPSLAKPSAWQRMIAQFAGGSRNPAPALDPDSRPDDTVPRSRKRYLQNNAGPRETPEHTTWEAEAFIPVSRFEIAEHLVSNGVWGSTSRDDVRRVFRYLAAWRHVVYKERLDELEQTYLPFSSETDLLRLGKFGEDQLLDYRARFIKGLRRLLKQANYIEVDRTEMVELMSNGSQYKLDLKVELADFEECILYRRGTDYKTEMRRSPWTLYLVEKEVQFPIYQRLCVLLKLWPEETRIQDVMGTQHVSRSKATSIVRNSRSSLPAGIEADKIYIKLFKDIPHSDLEMLFPNTKVRLSRFDKIKIGGSAASGVGIGLFGLITKLMAAAVFSPYALVVGLFGIGTIVFRQVMGFFNQRTQYMKVLAQNLYFHSLADNRSAFTLLANRAEEEDVKEEMLLYTVLATEQVKHSEIGEVRTYLSNWLRQNYDVDVDFEAEDALGRLMRDGIVHEDANGMLVTMKPNEALKHYDKMWDGYLQPGGMDRRLIDDDSKAEVRA